MLWDVTKILYIPPPPPARARTHTHIVTHDSGKLITFGKYLEKYQSEASESSGF